MQTTHLFVDADNPSYSLALPLFEECGVVETKVVLVKRGTTTYDDEVQFVHYVRRL